MHIFSNGNKPGIKGKFLFVCTDFIESFGKGFDCDIFRIGFVLGSFKNEVVDFLPENIEQVGKGGLASLFCFFYGFWISLGECCATL